jgi:hypothetical protein
MANQVMDQPNGVKSSGNTALIYRVKDETAAAETGAEQGPVERRRTSSWHLFGSGSVKGAHKWVRRCSYL